LSSEDLEYGFVRGDAAIWWVSEKTAGGRLQSRINERPAQLMLRTALPSARSENNDAAPCNSASDRRLNLID